MQQYTIMLLGIVSFAWASCARSQEDTQLSAAELVARCRSYLEEPGSDNAVFCDAYVRGFLDGAVSVDSRVRLVPEIESESWLERARRTRLPGSRLFGRPAYCIEAEVPRGQIIADLVAHAASSPPSAEIWAGDFLALVLRRMHPC